MKKTTTILSALLVAGLIAGSVSAFDDDRKSSRGGEKTDILAEYNIDADTLAELEALRESHQADKGEKSEKLDFENMSDEEKEAHKLAKEEAQAEMQAAREAHQEQVKTILADYPDAIEALETKWSQQAEKQELRKENRENGNTDDTKKKKRTEKKNGYKKNFSERLSGKIDSVSDERLETILEKITSFFDKIESNDTLSDEKKETLTTQLEALQEMIQEALDSRS